MSEFGAQLTILLNVLIALLLGGAIGYEREDAEKPAGLRTHMLVAGAAALLVGLGDIIVAHYVATVPGQNVMTDPVRVLQALATGIGFLGAGTILRRRGDGRGVEGLTTAASILFTSFIGIAVALAQYVVAVGATVLALIILRLIRIFEQRLDLDEKK